MQSAQCRKKYVAVNLGVVVEGTLHPQFIRWENGLIFKIEQILHKCRASSKKLEAAALPPTVAG